MTSTLDSFNKANEENFKQDKSLQFIKNLFLKSPIDAKRMDIKSIRGKESGLHYIEIISANEDVKFQYRIYVEEVE